LVVLVPGYISPGPGHPDCRSPVREGGAAEKGQNILPGQRIDYPPYAVVYGYLAFSATLFIPGLPWFVTATGSMLFLVLFSWA